MPVPVPVKRIIRSILLVDDNDDVRRVTAGSFAAAGKTVFTAASAAEARKIAKRERPDLAIIDLRLPDATGVQLIAELLAETPSLAVALFSGDPEPLAAAAAIKLGAIAVFHKPLSPRQLLRAVEQGDAPDLYRYRPDYPTLDENEWDHITRTLDLTGKNLTAAARLLGIRRAALQLRLRKAPPAGRAEWPYVRPTRADQRARRRSRIP